MLCVPKSMGKSRTTACPNLNLIDSQGGRNIPQINYHKLRGVCCKRNLPCNIDSASDLPPVRQPSPLPIFPPPPQSSAHPASPTAREFPGRAGRALDAMRARDAAAPARQPKPHVGLLLLPLSHSRRPRAWGGVDVAATATRAVGE